MADAGFGMPETRMPFVLETRESSPVDNPPIARGKDGQPVGPQSLRVPEPKRKGGDAKLAEENARLRGELAAALADVATTGGDEGATERIVELSGLLAAAQERIVELESTPSTGEDEDTLREAQNRIVELEGEKDQISEQLEEADQKLDEAVRSMFGEDQVDNMLKFKLIGYIKQLDFEGTLNLEDFKTSEQVGEQLELMIKGIRNGREEFFNELKDYLIENLSNLGKSPASPEDDVFALQDQLQAAIEDAVKLRPPPASKGGVDEPGRSFGDTDRGVPGTARSSQNSSGIDTDESELSESEESTADNSDGGGEGMLEQMQGLFGLGASGQPSGPPWDTLGMSIPEPIKEKLGNIYESGELKVGNKELADYYLSKGKNVAAVDYFRKALQTFIALDTKPQDGMVVKEAEGKEWMKRNIVGGTLDTNRDITWNEWSKAATGFPNQQKITMAQWLNAGGLIVKSYRAALPQLEIGVGAPRGGSTVQVQAKDQGVPLIPPPKLSNTFINWL
jgi:uncharacterized coiled-coil protein SlyX